MPVYRYSDNILIFYSYDYADVLTNLLAMTLGPWGFDLKVLIELLCIHAISKCRCKQYCLKYNSMCT